MRVETPELMNRHVLARVPLHLQHRRLVRPDSGLPPGGLCAFLIMLKRGVQALQHLGCRFKEGFRVRVIAACHVAPELFGQGFQPVPGTACRTTRRGRGSLFVKPGPGFLLLSPLP